MTEEERYKNLMNERQAALDNSNKTYNDLLSQNTAYSTGYNDYLNNYQNTQNDIYDKQTAYNVGLQEQNKQRAEQEFKKEATASKNAYYDFINPYGVQAEIQAQNGLNRSGYSETVKSQAWTTQQNRTAQARANLNNAKLQFDNAIKEAYMNNDIQKAQLALQLLEQQQQEALRSFNYASDIRLNQLGTNQNLDSEYNNRYNTLYNQIQDERNRAEAIRQWEKEQEENQRQFNEKMAYQKEQDKIAQDQWQKEYNLSRQKLYNTSSNTTNSKVVNNGTTLIDGSTNYEVNTPYYRGDLNADAKKYGTYSNGYQPKGISGHGTLKKSGDTLTFDTNTLSGQQQTLTQNIWKAEDGTNWYWDGRYNKYIQLK